MQSHARAGHVDIGRAVVNMADLDPSQAVAWFGAALFLLQRDLLAMSWSTPEEHNTRTDLVQSGNPSAGLH